MTDAISPPETAQPATGVLVIRHGLTQWNTDQRWQGWADIPLSETGLRQARFGAQTLAAMFDALPGVQRGSVRVVSSDLDRAHTTALRFAEALGVPEVERHESLRERHVGDWAGLTSHEINQRWPGILDRWRSGEDVPLPGGEDETGFRSRILNALTAEARRAAASRIPGVIVSHGGAIRTVEALLGVEARHVANVGGRWFHWNGVRVVPGEAVDLLDEPAADREGSPPAGANIDRPTREEPTGTSL